MSCDLTDPRLAKAYEEIRAGNGPIFWMVAGYNDTRDKISLYETGKSGFDEMRDYVLEKEEVLYIYIRIETKLALLTYISEKATGVKRARALVHGRAIGNKFSDNNLQLTVSTVADLNAKTVRGKLRLDRSLEKLAPLSSRMGTPQTSDSPRPLSSASANRTTPLGSRNKLNGSSESLTTKSAEKPAVKSSLGAAKTLSSSSDNIAVNAQSLSIKAQKSAKSQLGSMMSVKSTDSPAEIIVPSDDDEEYEHVEDITVMDLEDDQPPPPSRPAPPPVAKMPPTASVSPFQDVPQLSVSTDDMKEQEPVSDEFSPTGLYGGELSAKSKSGVIAVDDEDDDGNHEEIIQSLDSIGDIHSRSSLRRGSSELPSTGDSASNLSKTRGPSFSSLQVINSKPLPIQEIDERPMTAPKTTEFAMKKSASVDPAVISADAEILTEKVEKVSVKSEDPIAAKTGRGSNSSISAAQKEDPAVKTPSQPKPDVLQSRVAELPKPLVNSKITPQGAATKSTSSLASTSTTTSTDKGPKFVPIPTPNNPLPKPIEVTVNHAPKTAPVVEPLAKISQNSSTPTKVTPNSQPPPRFDPPKFEKGNNALKQQQPKSEVKGTDIPEDSEKFGIYSESLNGGQTWKRRFYRINAGQLQVFEEKTLGSNQLRAFPLADIAAMEEVEEEIVIKNSYRLTFKKSAAPDYYIYFDSREACKIFHRQLGHK